MKFVVKLGLSRKSALVKVEFGKHVHGLMNGNANFTTPSPTLAALLTATTDLETAVDNADGGGTLLTSKMHDMEVVFDEVMTAMGNYVDSVAVGAETIIKSAGMETKRQRSPVGIPAKVAGLAATSGKKEGEIDLSYSKVFGKLIYLVYIKADGEADDLYKLIAKPSKTKVTIVGLTSGSKYWFRVEAVGSAGTGALSDPAMSRAL